MIHAASDEADQAHSGCVLIPMVVLAPLELTGEAGGVRATVHFVGDGPVDVATVEPHPAAAQANSQVTTYVSGLASGGPVGIRGFPRADRGPDFSHNPRTVVDRFAVRTHGRKRASWILRNVTVNGNLQRQNQCK